MPFRLSVVVPTPAHSTIAGPLSYGSELALPPGSLVRVPLGKREVMGVVWDELAEPASDRQGQEDRPIAASLDAIAPLSAAWRQLVTFSSSYYRRSLGEVALAALPPQLRDLDVTQLARRLKRERQGAGTAPAQPPIALTDQQQAALAAFHAGA